MNDDLFLYLLQAVERFSFFIILIHRGEAEDQLATGAVGEIFSSRRNCDD